MKRGILSWIWVRTQVYVLAVHICKLKHSQHTYAVIYYKTHKTFRPDMPTEMLTHTHTHTETDTQTGKHYMHH